MVCEIVGNLSGSILEVSDACTSTQIHVKSHRSSTASGTMVYDNEVSRFDSEHDNNVLYRGC
jgi:hypothetical protein